MPLPEEEKKQIDAIENAVESEEPVEKLLSPGEESPENSEIIIIRNSGICAHDPHGVKKKLAPREKKLRKKKEWIGSYRTSGIITPILSSPLSEIFSWFGRILKKLKK